MQPDVLKTDTSNLIHVTQCFESDTSSLIFKTESMHPIARIPTSIIYFQPNTLNLMITTCHFQPDNCGLTHNFLYLIPDIEHLLLDT